MDPGVAAPEPAGKLNIRLVPGRAFGTGEHPTTRLCRRVLEQRVRRGRRWLDLGGGSGILTTVSLLLGASEVVCADTDPEAVSVAREVLEANGLLSVLHKTGTGE